MIKEPNIKTALVFGATGLVGNELTNLLLSDNNYNSVKIFVRKKTELKHPKLTQIVNALENAEEVANEIKGEEVFCCLGTTIKKAGSQKAFERIDLELPVKIAEIASKNGVKKFIIVSSIGANRKSGNFYLRTKGKMEEAVLSQDIEGVYVVRPSILLGKRLESRAGEAFGKVFMGIFSFLMMGSLKKYRGIQAGTVAKAMIRLAGSGEKRLVLESDKVEELGS
jgi:uncharacterized protein YbjT (DUF2867 family)